METILAFQNCVERLQFAKAAQILRCSLKDDLRASMSFLFAPLLLLTSCESLYYSMSFLPEDQGLSVKVDDKGDRLKTIYSTVLSDLNQVCAVLDTVANYSSSTDEVIQAQFLTRLIKHWRSIIVIRRKLTKVYCAMEEKSAAPHYKPLLDILVNVKSQLEREVDHPLMGQMKDNIIIEIDVLSLIMNIQMSISQFDYKETIFDIYQAKSYSDSLKNKLPGLDEETIDPLELKLFKYFKNYLTILTAKTCLYFKDAFFARDERDLSKIKKVYDFNYHITEFIETNRNAAFSIIRYLKPQPTVRDSKHDHHPDVTGLQMWPTIYSYTHLQDLDRHRPNVVSLIQDNKKYLSNYIVPPFYFWDTSINTTYFIVKVDKFFYAILLFEELRKRNDEDITKFLDSLTQKLRNWTVSSFNYK